MAEEKNVDPGHLGSALAEAESTATARVEDDARDAVVPDEIAGGCALVLRLRSAGAEHLDRDPRRAAGLCREARWVSGDDDCGKNEQGFGGEFERVHRSLRTLWVEDTPVNK